MIICTRAFLRSLITNLSSTFRKSKCQMQYVGLEYKKQEVMPQRFFCGIHFSHDSSFVQIHIYIGIFRVADYESDLRFSKSIWRIQYGGRKFEKLSDYAENLYIDASNMIANFFRIISDQFR